MDSYSGSLPRKLISFRLGGTPDEGKTPTTSIPEIPQKEIFAGENSANEATVTSQVPAFIETPTKIPSSLGATETVGSTQLLDPPQGKVSSGETQSDSESVGSFIEKFLSEKDLTEESAGDSAIEKHVEKPALVVAGSPVEKPNLDNTDESIPRDPRLAKRKAESQPAFPASDIPHKLGKHVQSESASHSATEDNRPQYSKSSLSGKILISRRDQNTDHSYLRAVQVLEYSPEMESRQSEAGGTEEETEKEATNSLVGERIKSAAKSVNDLSTRLGIAVAPGNSEEEAEEYGVSLLQRGGHEMSGDSHTLINQCFESNPPVRFPSGHTSVSFSEPQVSCLVKTVSEETAIASFRMMKDILLKAAALRPIHDQKISPSSKFRTSKGRSRSPVYSSGDESVDYRGKGYESAALSSEDGFQSLVFCKDANAPSDGELAAVTAAFSSQFTSPNNVEISAPLTPGHSQSSQDQETLAVIRDKTLLAQKKVVNRKKASARNAARQKIPDSEKPHKPTRILKEDSFDGLEWTRIFACGPLKPEDNMYSFYCLMCKKNVSMYGKGRSELVRHYQRKSHFRIDQRWRYEHLRHTDPVTGVVKHYVRGLDGRVLDRVELPKELPLFENSTLVELGPRFPYYDDYLQGLQHSGLVFEDRASIQLSVFSKFLTYCSNLTLLGQFWSEVGNITNHQSLFVGFNWTEERLSVSIHL